MNYEKKHTILAVDDVAMNRQLLQGMLVKSGYEVILAINGKDALQKVQETPPEAILLDIMMPPGINGFEVCERLKADPALKNIPVIFISAMTETEDKLKAFAAGGVDYITKPFQFEEINARLETHLRLRRQQLELKKLNAELKHDQSLAENVFNNILSEIPSNYTNISFSLIPMSKVGGDIFLSTKVFVDRQYVFLGDFTGHGLSAAIGAIPVSEIFSQIQDNSHSIEDIARKMNKKLKALLPTSLFLCACLIEVDYSADKIHVWIGGLPDALIFNRNNQLKQRILSKHLPLGILGDNKFDDKPEVISVDEGDQIFFFSDGITEAENKEGEMFGQERLENFITNCRNPENSIDEIVKNLNSFCKDADQSDDITIATIRYHKILCKL